MSSIRETVQQRLGEAGLSGYTRQAEPVIVALEDREAEISAELVTFASDNGLSKNQATDLLTGLGMTVKAEANGNAENADAISTIESTLREIQEQLRNLRG